MRIFDTTIQMLKYEVLKALIRDAYEHDIENIYVDVPKMISPGPKANLRCCVYKERAIVQERIKLALNNSNNPNMVEVIDIACDECPMGGVYVSQSCRGCIVHRCQAACPKEAIEIVDKKAVINKARCIECGKCLDACQFDAIIERKRPCIRSCKVDAIKVDPDNKKAIIDNDKCITCGACVYQCPFGAIVDKSLVMDVIDILKGSDNNKNYNVYAVVAPSIAAQFNYAKIEQVVSGLQKIGFKKVVEAALGADITLHHELNEFKEKKTLTTSCCPSFVMYVEKNFPELVEYISHTVSPMVETALLIKSSDPTAKVIFIGPCVSKKQEYKLPKTKGAIDCVLSFEELQAFFDARDVDITTLEETPLDDASYYGRIFAYSGGITKGITDLAKEQGIEDFKPVAMNGVNECKQNLLKLKFKKAEENFFEGMICEGGCANGPLCLHRDPKNINQIEKHGKEATKKDITNSVKLYEQSKK